MLGNLFLSIVWNISSSGLSDFLILEYPLLQIVVFALINGSIQQIDRLLSDESKTLSGDLLIPLECVAVRFHALKGYWAWNIHLICLWLDTRTIHAKEICTPRFTTSLLQLFPHLTGWPVHPNAYSWSGYTWSRFAHLWAVLIWTSFRSEMIYELL